MKTYHYEILDGLYRCSFEESTRYYGKQVTNFIILSMNLYTHNKNYIYKYCQRPKIGLLLYLYIPVFYACMCYLIYMAKHTGDLKKNLIITIQLKRFLVNFFFLYSEIAVIVCVVVFVGLL